MQQNLDRMQCRAFNQLTKKLVYGYGYRIVDNMVILFDKNGREVNVDRGHCMLQDLHFSTGLKDKNGKLIFEGDIIQMYSPNIKGLIFFDDFYSCMKIQAIDNNGDYQGEATLVTKSFLNSSVVIGNIYEQPQLLEKQ